MTFNGANSLVSKFCDLGLLEEITGGARRRRFVEPTSANRARADGRLHHECPSAAEEGIFLTL